MGVGAARRHSRDPARSISTVKHVQLRRRWSPFLSREDRIWRISSHGAKVVFRAGTNCRTWRCLDVRESTSRSYKSCRCPMRDRSRSRSDPPTKWNRIAVAPVQLAADRTLNRKKSHGYDVWRNSHFVASSRVRARRPFCRTTPHRGTHRRIVHRNRRRRNIPRPRPRRPRRLAPCAAQGCRHRRTHAGVAPAKSSRTRPVTRLSNAFASSENDTEATDGAVGVQLRKARKLTTSSPNSPMPGRTQALANCLICTPDRHRRVQTKNIGTAISLGSAAAKSHFAGSMTQPKRLRLPD